MGSSASCTGCAAGTYGSGSGLSSCVSCTAETYISSSGMSSCNSCTSGKYATGSASTVCTQQPTTSVVPQNSLTVVMSLPMTKSDFEARQVVFIACLASSFGVLASQVRIQSVVEISTRAMQFPARRLSSAAVSVSSTVETSSRVEQSYLSQQLVTFGLPSPTAVNILYSDSQLTSSRVATSTWSPTNSDNVTTSSAASASLPVAIIAAVGGVGGFLAVMLTAFCYYRTFCSKGSAKPDKSAGNNPHGIAVDHISGGLVLPTPEPGSVASAVANTINLVEGEDLKGAYHPVHKFAENPPHETCSASILQCSASLGIPEDKAKAALNEADKTVSSKLGTHEVQQLLSKFGTPEEKLSHALAIVMYTLDFSLIDLTFAKEDNFYFKLNQLLRKRKTEDLMPCSAYLYYLMRGLERLPSYTANKVLWRGVDFAGRETLLENYTRGRKIHWSGFSSASLDQSVAKQFSGRSGVLLQVRLVENYSQARDIRAFSAIPSESEILLLPNFTVTVISDLNRLDGWDMLELQEVNSSTFVF